MAGHDRNRCEKDDAADNIVQRGHGDQRIGHRPVCFELPDNGQCRGRGGSQGDPAKNKRQIDGDVKEAEHNAEHQRYKQEGPQGLGERCDDDSPSGTLQLPPYQFGADHQAHPALQNVNDNLIPPGIQDLLADE